MDASSFHPQILLDWLVLVLEDVDSYMRVISDATVIKHHCNLPHDLVFATTTNRVLCIANIN